MMRKKNSTALYRYIKFSF